MGARSIPQEIRDETVRLYNAGVERARIAQKLGIGKTTVAVFLQEAGILKTRQFNKKHGSRDTGYCQDPELWNLVLGIGRRDHG